MKPQQRPLPLPAPDFFSRVVGPLRHWLLVVVCVGVSVASGADLIKVQGKVLTDQDLDQYLSANLAEGAKTPGVNTPDGRAQALQSLVDQELLVGQAERDKLDQSEDYKTALQMARRQILINLLLTKKLGPKLTEAETKKFYEEHPELFSADQARVVHVLVATNDEALQILAQAKKPGVDLQDIAEKSSKDPTAKQNRGDVGYFTRDNVVREFADAVFGAKKGALIGPVKTPYGYHVIKIIDFKVGRVKNYPEVEVQAKALHREEALQIYLSELRDGAQIQRLSGPTLPAPSKPKAKTRAR